MNFIIFKNFLKILKFLLFFCSFIIFSVFGYFVFKNVHLNSTKLLIKYFYLVIFIYLAYSTFVFLSNSNKIIYNSYNQRFYKRSFMLFWTVEFFLFFIFTYLTLISPAESNIVLDSTRLIFYRKDNFYFFSLQLIFLAFMTVVTNIIIYLNNSKQKIYINFLLLITFFTFFIFFYIELIKFYYSISFFKYKGKEKRRSKFLKYKNLFLIYNIKNTSYINKMRTQNFFLLILNILKFWHIVFIYLFYLFNIAKVNKNTNISYDILSAIHYNYIYLMFFHFYCYLIFFKTFFYYWLTNFKYNFWYEYLINKNIIYEIAETLLTFL